MNKLYRLKILKHIPKFVTFLKTPKGERLVEYGPFMPGDVIHLPEVASELLMSKRYAEIYRDDKDEK